MKYDPEEWTFGAEHELSDWNCSTPLPEGFARSPDYTIVNSNGIAAQPNSKMYGYGGEINTPPTSSIDEQAALLEKIPKGATINYRSNLHIHIRVPGLKDNLVMLKQIQLYIHEQLPKVIGVVEPIPKGHTPAEKKREKRRRVSHQTFLTSQRLKHQLAATTVKEFLEREVPATKSGAPMWHAQPRLAVGLRQLLQTDTVEFRHFPGTLDCSELRQALRWCNMFMRGAIKNIGMNSKWIEDMCEGLPKFLPFNEELEIGYQATAAHNGLKQHEIKANIHLILEGKFHGSEAYTTGKAKANGQAG